ncbi:hypothetical protein OX459_15755 [Janthinobacterium sp. SUN026]|uniref:hypothetical protein n=1 Tax=Janthinobacterium sp. SUN026 TaxID=3002438 RepID=UPI0025B266EF|nr:hypothetical protein [Janthinobacterium sp. SUN026]MDN2672858.1 hypothetical protein [Janthinobacterium sp. SUN026]
MPLTQAVSISDLVLDLKNFRTVEQENESEAVQAMIAVSPDYFWGLMDSLIQDGYLPTENIIVLQVNETTRLVKEGNRRIAALKIIHGLISVSSLSFPTTILSRIASLSAQWKAENLEVPCAIYPFTEADTVDRIVTLTHGKGEKAGRDQWNTVARARHNRDMNSGSEPALDLLEKYFKHATNHTQQQVERWSGDYSLSVLDEAIKKVAGRFGALNSPDLAKIYPSIQYKIVLDDIILAIGLKTLGFKKIRAITDFTLDYGMPAPTPTPLPGEPDPSVSPQGGPVSGGPTPAPAPAPGTQGGQAAGGGTAQPDVSGLPPSPGAATPTVPTPGNGKVSTTPINDEKSVRRALKALKISGQNRAKLATLRIEAGKLKLKDNPIAFCFVLRSMFEIAGKAYCEDHAANGGPTAKKGGVDKSLLSLLRDITTHLTQNSSDQAMLKVLHGALTQLAKPDGILSVTSMNQLVHNPSFTITESDICSLFGNVFPLLQEMNK